MKEYTKILADYAAGLKYEELPADVVEQAKKIILHTIAVSIASSNMSPTVNAAAVAAARRSGPDATIWGAKGVRVSPSDAVYANGTRRRRARLGGLHLDRPRLGGGDPGLLCLRRAEACRRQGSDHRHRSGLRGLPADRHGGPSPTSTPTSPRDGAGGW